MSARGTADLVRTDCPCTVDPRVFRSVCGTFATGVTVVTSGTAGPVAGLTVNSFTSVSLDPPLILVCIHNESSVLPALRRAGAFAVNILAADQEDICRSFAGRHPHRAAETDTRRGRTGAPILSDALAYLDCRLDREVDGGDHTIVIGEVLELSVQREDEPLVFFRNTFNQLPVST
jgi:3-hydroxy-9,10-secoandrosta-1,3,5(10)-triene-9,17-dione monooxygenase reductase component